MREPGILAHRPHSQLAERDAQAGTTFVEQYGWDPLNRVAVDGTVEDELEYDGQTVPRAIETGGSISHGEITPENSVSQVFPYSVKDIYGSTVYPPNIENVTEVQQNNHDPWPPSSLLERAKNNLVVRESTASFSFHPFLDHDYLREMVDGLQEMDYEFVSVTDLR